MLPKGCGPSSVVFSDIIILQRCLSDIIMSLNSIYMLVKVFNNIIMLQKCLNDITGSKRARGCGVYLTHTDIVTVRTVALISLTNTVTCATWNKHVHLKEQPENIWLLSLMWWSWLRILQWDSRWLVGPNRIPRAFCLVNCLLTVFLYNYSPRRQNWCQACVNSLVETFWMRSQGRQINMLWCNKYFHHKQITLSIPPVTVTLGV